MTNTQFWEAVFYWGYGTSFEAFWIATQWQGHRRVLGAGVYLIPVLRLVRRGVCERRVDALLTALENNGVPVGDRPDKEQLVDRWHRIAAGRCVAVLVPVVPWSILVVSFELMGAPNTFPSLWMNAVVAGCVVLTLALVVADGRAAAVSDAAGAATVEAIRFLETLLIPARHRTNQSALDEHGRTFGRLIQALRAQARHETHRMSPVARERVRLVTERLIATLVDSDHRYLFGEGADRDTAARELSRLASNALSHSCRPRAQLDGPLFVDPRLLENAPEADPAATVAEPLKNRVLTVAGGLATAVSLFAGAALFSDSVASGMMVFAGLASVALVYPPLREVLPWARDSVLGGPPANDEAGVAEPPLPPAPPSSTTCPDCAARSAATAGARPVG